MTQVSPFYDLIHTSLRAQIQALEAQLWVAQLEAFPDSIRVSRHQARLWAETPTADSDKLSIYRGIAAAIHYPVGVFYECGFKDGRFQWRGFRYGVQGSEYLSGFGRE